MAVVILFSNKKKYVLKLKRKQRLATKMVPDLENLTYEERLKEMHLTTLKERKGEIATYLDGRAD